MTTRFPAMVVPNSLRRASVAMSTPRLVAASLPNDPPRPCLFPTVMISEKLTEFNSKYREARDWH